VIIADPRWGVYGRTQEFNLHYITRGSHKDVCHPPPGVTQCVNVCATSLQGSHKGVCHSSPPPRVTQRCIPPSSKGHRKVRETPLQKSGVAVVGAHKGVCYILQGSRKGVCHLPSGVTQRGVPPPSEGHMDPPQMGKKVCYLHYSLRDHIGEHATSSSTVAPPGVCAIYAMSPHE
jgi:hypothetical protein